MASPARREPFSSEPLDRTPGATRQRVKELTDAKVLPREIALMLGISTSAVYQHLARLKEEVA